VWWFRRLTIDSAFDSAEQEPDAADTVESQMEE
jgi:hypothetical protein